MDGININKLLGVCKMLSLAILENGGETYRAEDVVERACMAYSVDVDVFALPTGIFISLSGKDSNYQTCIKRIKKRGVNLSVIDFANNIARMLSSKEISIDKAFSLASDLVRPAPKSSFKKAAAAAACTGCFAVLFGGGLYDFLISAVCGFLIQITTLLFSKQDMYHFIMSILGGIIGATVALISDYLGFGNQDAIISASIMTLVPGLSMVNSIRDTMRGDLVSGIARAGEAIIISLSIAAGVGMVFGLWGLLGFA